MKNKKASAGQSNKRITVRLSTDACNIVNYYSGFTGYGDGEAVAKLIQLGDFAFKSQQQAVDAMRKVIIADAKLAELNRITTKKVRAIRKEKIAATKQANGNK